MRGFGSPVVATAHRVEILGADRSRGGPWNNNALSWLKPFSRPHLPHAGGTTARSAPTVPLTQPLSVSFRPSNRNHYDSVLTAFHPANPLSAVSDGELDGHPLDGLGEVRAHPFDVAARFEDDVAIE